SKDSSRSVRLGVLLALSRMQRPEVAVFLNDSDPGLVLEAARAINDEPLTSGTPDLAALIKGTPGRQVPTNPHLLRRVLYANLRLGNAENAQWLAEFATNS